MSRRWLALGLIVLLLAMASTYLWHRGGHAAAAATAAAEEGDDDVPTVSTVTVRSASWQSQAKAFGQLRAVQGTNLSAEVAGIVEEISFESGQEVAAGTVLLRLRGNDDEAKLASLQASAELWTANLARDRKQFELQAISRATLDQDQASLRNFQAQVSAQRALMEEKVVRAPFAGKVGIREVDRGQYLVAGTPLTSLQALDPIYVDFNLPQQELAQVVAGQFVEVTLDGMARPATAKVLAVDNRVDVASRMGTVRAVLPNPRQQWLPGMFAVVRVADAPARQVLSLPLSSISYSPHGDYIYVLSPASKSTMIATLRAVRLGQREGDRVVVEQGLRAGETVVTAGQIKLRNGARVRVNNQLRPADQWRPAPIDP